MKKKTAANDEDDVKAETRTVRGVGDNNPPEIAGAALKKIIKNLQGLDRQKDQLMQEIREVFADAKGKGLDNKTIRRILREEKMEPEKLMEQNELHRLYRDALGLLDE